jgi:general stress protein 26
MASMTLEDLAAKIRKIDFCMMSTHTSSDAITNRPMSNNGDVEYDGDSWFFSFRETGKVADIARNPQVTLSFTEPPSLLGKPGMFISIEGKGEVIDDKTQFEQHWVSGLKRWFPEATDTPGLVLIKVRGERIQYWDGEDNGAIDLQPPIKHRS